MWTKLTTHCHCVGQNANQLETFISCVIQGKGTLKTMQSVLCYLAHILKLINNSKEEKTKENTTVKEVWKSELN